MEWDFDSQMKSLLVNFIHKKAYFLFVINLITRTKEKYRKERRLQFCCAFVWCVLHVCLNIEIVVFYQVTVWPIQSTQIIILAVSKKDWISFWLCWDYFERNGKTRKFTMRFSANFTIALQTASTQPKWISILIFSFSFSCYCFVNK